MQQNNANGNCIIVIPFDCATFEVIQKRIIVHKLHFWYNNTLDHPVNKQNLELFLSHVKMFKPTVYPDAPESGCYALNIPATYKNGEAGVHQIHYMGQIVYCRC